MNKTKGLLTINKSKDTLKGIRTIEDLKQALEQDIMRYESKITTKVKNNLKWFSTFDGDENDRFLPTVILYIIFNIIFFGIAFMLV